MVISAAARSRPSWPGAGADAVLTWKVTPPCAPEWVIARPRLDRLITEGVLGPLTVLTGPPGAGKTTAIGSWIAASAGSGPVAWVTLDRFDNRPGVFWSYVVTALRRAGVAVDGAVWAPAGDEAVDHGFLIRLASAVAAGDRPVVLVLDDLHLVTEAGLLDGLAYVLRNAQPALRLVLCSRLDPLLPLHRYRLAGELTEIRSADLALSVPEAGLLMAQHGVTLPAASLATLTELTEGWAAGLRLAAMSMDQHPDPGQVLQEIAHDSAIAGYLVEEVLNAQSAPTRDLLLRTSILDSVSEGIAAELTDEGQGASPLAALARANAFVLPLGNGWYRYHSLFAEVLRLKLRLERPGRVAELHRRAARWYQRNGSLTDAVRQAGEAGDWELAASIVIDGLAVGEFIDTRGPRPLAGSFRDMPRNLARAGPQPPLLAAALAWSDGQYEASSASLGLAERILAGLPAAEEVTTRLGAAVIRLAASRRCGDLGAAAAAAGRAEALLGTVPGSLLARHPAISAQVLSDRGAVEFWSGHFDAAASSLNAAAAAAAPPECAHELAGSLGHLALLNAARGQLSRAAELATAAAGMRGGDGGAPAEHRCPAAEVALAWVHLERHQLHEARSWLKRADATLREHPDMLIGSLACLAAARDRLAAGQASAASDMIRRARQGWSPPRWLEQRLTVAESRAFAAAGDVTSALQAAERTGPQGSLEAAVAHAQAWLAAGDLPAAARALAGLPAAVAAAPENIRLESWLADAQLAYRTGDRTRGRRSLEQALRLGHPEQLRLPFAMERAWLRPFLDSQPGIARAYRQLLQPRRLPPARTPPGHASTAAPVIVEQLSDREREVLGHVSAMLSTAEIATEMYISVNTVKTHLKSIYRKLAAGHRGEAVRRARQLQML